MARYYATNAVVSVAFIGNYKWGVHDKYTGNKCCSETLNSTLIIQSKTLKAIHHRGTEGTEFYFVNCTYGAVL